MPTTRTTAANKTATKKTVSKKTPTKKATAKKAVAKKPSPSPRFKKNQSTKVESEKKIEVPEEVTIAPPAQSTSDLLGPRQQVVITPTSSEYASEDGTPPSNRPSSITDQLNSLAAKQSSAALPVEDDSLESPQAPSDEEVALEDQPLEVPAEASAKPRKRIRGTLAFIVLLSLLGVGSAVLTYYLFQLLAS